MGIIASAGVVILQGASEGNRLLYPNTQLLLHVGEDGFSGHPKNLERSAEQSKKMRMLMYDIMRENCGDKSLNNEKRAYWDRKLDFDWWINAEQAVELGIADGIIDNNSLEIEE